MWRAGDKRKQYLWDFCNFPDPETVNAPSFVIDMSKIELTGRQQRILDMILKQIPKIRVMDDLDISRWVVNYEIRRIKGKIQESLVERI